MPSRSGSEPVTVSTATAAEDVASPCAKTAIGAVTAIKRTSLCKQEKGIRKLFPEIFVFLGLQHHTNPPVDWPHSRTLPDISTHVADRSAGILPAVAGASSTRRRRSALTQSVFPTLP